jgi:hypothetical protein
MTIPLILFVLFAVLLVLLLAWAARPPSHVPLTPEQALRALSEERHYARLPQILQSLREEDTEFMRNRGHQVLLQRLRTERRHIALRYLGCLEEEFRVLLECSRILATLAPELGAKSEFDRFRQNLWFAWNCRYLRWRLQLGLQPWDVFGVLSDMAGTITLQLEAATMQLGERALLATNSGLLPDDRRGNSE